MLFEIMYLYTITDNRTMKNNWYFGGEECSKCQYRFECFTDDRVHVRPVKIDITEITNLYRNEFKLEFHLPKCLKLGLYKQLADTGCWGRGYMENFDDGFKLGVIVEEEEEERIDIEHSWIKFPNILYVTGTIKK